MVMIIICHIGTAVDNSAIGQIFQVGVQLFIFISGYLYGRKDIPQGFHWLKGRFLRICLPFYLFIAYSIVLNIVLHIRIDWLMVLFDLLNLQGYHHIICEAPYLSPLAGTAHLWYLTALLGCYVFTIAVKNFEKRRALQNKEIILLMSFLLILTLILGMFGIRIDYLFIYMLGYFYARRTENRVDLPISLLILFVACLARLLTKRYCDIHGDTNFYLYVIIPLSYNLMAFGIYKIIAFFTPVFTRICENETIKRAAWFVDSISFYVYITHYQFVDGPIQIIHKFGNLPLEILVIICLTGITAVVLKFVSEKVIGLINTKQAGALK